MGKKNQKEKSRPAAAGRKVLVALATALAVLLALGGALAAVYQNRTLPFVAIGEVSLANKTKDQLIEILASVDLRSITLIADNKTKTIKPNDIDLTIDANASADNLIFLSDLKSIWQLEFLRPQKSVFNINEQKLNLIIDDLAQGVDKPVKNARVEYVKGKLVIKDEAANGLKLNKDYLRSLIIAHIEIFDFSPIVAQVMTVNPAITSTFLAAQLPDVETIVKKGLMLTTSDDKFEVEPAQLLSFIKFAPSGDGIKFEADETKIAAYVKTLSKQIDRAVKDAQLKIVDGKVEVFQSSQDGRSLDRDKTVALIKDAIAERKTVAELPIAVTAPKVTTGSVNDFGIKELIGAAATNFKGSPENRKHNISVGAGLLNGIIIMPGQTFSTLAALGAGKDITGEQGYLPELVIKENKTIPEFGGGLCQVSTTLFRSALNSGLPINERRNHSWRISYYEPPYAIDATVYYPNTDLKFTNTTPGAIVIQSKIEGTTLTFEFYGSKDGRRAEVSSKMLSSIPAPSPEYIETDTLPRGETKQTEKPHPGGKGVAYYKVYDNDGRLVIDETYNSVYKPVAARFLVGTAEPASAPADQSPSDQPPSQ